MLYQFLLTFVDSFGFLNVFKYLTFRTGLSAYVRHLQANKIEMSNCRIGSLLQIHDIATLGKNTFCPFMFALDWLKIMQRKFLMTPSSENDRSVSFEANPFQFLFKIQPHEVLR